MLVGQLAEIGHQRTVRIMCCPPEITQFQTPILNFSRLITRFAIPIILNHATPNRIIREGDKMLETRTTPRTFSCLLLFAILFTSGLIYASSNSSPPPSAKVTANSKSDVGQNVKKFAPNNHEAKDISTIVEATNSPLIYQKTTENNSYFSSEWWAVYITGLLSLITALLAYYTGSLYHATVALGREAKASGEAQSNKMERSIGEAMRAASAMEKLATSAAISSKAATDSVTALKQRTAQQMRAYLTVLVGSGIYQERAKNLKFDVRPSLINSGHTPAHGVDYWARAKILPFPLPVDFEFTEHENPIHSSMVLGPQQVLELNAVVDDFVPDEDVASIKSGGARRVYVWGRITYTDVFNEPHSTKFCHSICWFGQAGDEKVTGTYSSHHNEAT